MTTPIEEKTDRQRVVEIARDVLTNTGLIDSVDQEAVLGDPALLAKRVMGSRAYRELADNPKAQAALVTLAQRALTFYLALPLDERNLPLRQCQHCDTLFRPKRFYYRFCSYRCARAANESQNAAESDSEGRGTA